MARVEDWLGDFMAKHLARCPREDWPRDDSEATLAFYDAWRHAFVTRGIEHRFADLASLDMAAEPPAFLSQHLPMVVKLALEWRRRHDAESDTSRPMDSLEAATDASKACPDCGGSGLAVRYVWPEQESRLRAPVGSRVAMHCGCPLGCFMHRDSGQSSERKRARVASVADFPEMLIGPVDWSPWLDNQYRHRPEDWDAELGQPFAERVAIQTPSDLKAFCGSLASSSRLPGRTPSEASRRLQEASLARRPVDRPSRPDRPVLGRPDAILDAEYQSSRPANSPDSIEIPEDFV